MMPRIITIILIIVFLATSSHAKLTFTETFESGTFSQWLVKEASYAGSGLKIESGTARAGTKAAHFTCTDCSRSEITSVSTSFQWYKEYWLGYSFYLTSFPSGWGIINQHHSVPGGADWSCVSGPNTFTITAKDGKFYFHTTTIASKVDVIPPMGSATWATEKIEVDAELGVWHDVVYHFYYAPDSSGYLQVWFDGALIIDHKGPNTYKKDLCGKDREPRQYLKIGVYLGGGTGDIYYDEIRLGDSSSSKKEVSPGGGSTTCQSLGGTCCQQSQTCAAGQSKTSDDCQSCCVGGTCTAVDSCLSVNELMQLLSRWKENELTFASILQSVRTWKEGC